MNDREELITQATRNLISEIAPQELPIFRSNCEAYFKNPEKALEQKKEKDEVLGFGGGDAVFYLTPVALAILTRVVNFIFDQATKSIKDESANLIKDHIKFYFKKLRPGEVKENQQVRYLTGQQKDEIKKLVREEVIRLKSREKRKSPQKDKLLDGYTERIVETLINNLNINE